MQRIIDGFLYEGKKSENSFNVRTFEVNGHRELSIRRCIDWVEVCESPAYARCGSGFQGASTADDVAKWAAQDVLDAQKRLDHCLKASAMRAQVMCRRVIKAESFNELLTLTYRSNMTDRATCKKHFKEWVRRMKKALGDFRYCASFEQQKRGAMHVHIACNKLPAHAVHKNVKIKAWELGTRIWRDVIGNYQFEGPLQPAKEWPVLTNGMCFVGGKSRFGGDKRKRNMSIAKMAAYVSKYILKDHAAVPAEKNRYSRSNGTVIPKSMVTRYDQTSMAELIGLVFELHGSDVVVSHWLDNWGDGWGLTTEPAPCHI